MDPYFPKKIRSRGIYRSILWEKKKNQAGKRCEYIPGVDKKVVEKLQKMLHEHNFLIKTFKTAFENMPDSNYKVVTHPDKKPSSGHERSYNAPTVNEVAAIVTGNEYGSRDIVLHTRKETLSRVPDTHKYYDALQYPLIFSKGQEGYNFEIWQCDPITGQPLFNKKVSCMEFYAYHMMLRPDSFNVLLRFKHLFHQFLEDVYVKVESERLRYISLNQSKLRADSYIHLRDSR